MLKMLWRRCFSCSFKTFVAQNIVRTLYDHKYQVSIILNMKKLANYFVF